MNGIKFEIGRNDNVFLESAVCVEIRRMRNVCVYVCVCVWIAST